MVCGGAVEVKVELVGGLVVVEAGALVELDEDGGGGDEPPPGYFALIAAM